MLNIPDYDWGNVLSPWIGADMDFWKNLLENRKPTEYKKGQTIFRQGDMFRDAFIIDSGRARVSISDPNGQEKTLYIALRGAMIGETSCILSQPHTMSAVCNLESRIYCIPSKELQDFFHRDYVLADMLLQYEARKTHALISQTATLSFDTAEQRIAKTLIYVSETHGIQTKNGIKLDVHFTLDDIGVLVNISRVTVSYIFSAWKKEGIIDKIEGKYYVKNPSLLQELGAKELNS